MPKTPRPIGKLNQGMKMMLTRESGNARAVIVSAPYTAPLAPRDGRMAWCAARACAELSRAGDCSARRRRGRRTRFVNRCEPKLENRPAARRNARKWGVCVEVARCGSAGSGVARYVYAAEPNEMSAIELNA